MCIEFYYDFFSLLWILLLFRFIIKTTPSKFVSFSMKNFLLLPFLQLLLLMSSLLCSIRPIRFAHIFDMPIFFFSQTQTNAPVHHDGFFFLRFRSGRYEEHVCRFVCQQCNEGPNTAQHLTVWASWVKHHMDRPSENCIGSCWTIAKLPLRFGEEEFAIFSAEYTNYRLQLPQKIYTIDWPSIWINVK